jgi:structural maintenance of chromosome 4
MQIQQRKHNRYRERMGELDAITKQRDLARGKFDALRKKRLEMFSEGFFTIKMKLKEMYRMLTLGGDAELEQVRERA